MIWKALSTQHSNDGKEQAPGPSDSDDVQQQKSEVNESMLLLLLNQIRQRQPMHS